MASVVSSNKTIAKNTLFTYVRMLFNLVVSLYTSRVILQVLGVNDLGVYQVVGGIVAIFSFIGVSMAGANSRFLAYELPKGNIERLRQTFAASLNANIIMTCAFLLVAETIGVWLVRNILVIPDGREFASMCVYQFSVLATCFSILQSPYQAAIIAHEKISVFAYIGIIDTLLKLGICYITLILPFDKLVCYAMLILVCGIGIQGLYWIYCRKHFQECRYNRIKDWKILKPMMAFSGWDMFAGFCFGAKQQGLNIILNIFFTVAINAACGFSNSIYGAVRGFANSFMLSVRPVITKSYSIKDYNRMQELIIDSGKYSFCLILLLSFPFFLEGDFIITLWLKNPPVWTTSFCQIQLFTCVISVIFSPVYYGVMATGNNKVYSIIDGVLMIVVLPLTYILLKFGFTPITPFVILVGIEVLKDNLYTFILKKNMREYSVKKFYTKCVLPCVVMFICCTLLSLIPHYVISSDGWVRALFSFGISCVLVILVTYRFMLSKGQRYSINQKLRELFSFAVS
uniref:Oligosaccharide flippase family protein n=2 Tax=unclassified Prevotella TaxID=2638335 RepID=A0AB33J368_9BACT